MTRRLVLPALSLLALAAPAAAAADYPSDQRPHAVVLLRNGGPLVARFQVAARPSHGRVRVNVVLTARARSSPARRFVLRIGRCTGGSVAHPSCPANVSRSITLSPISTTVRRLATTVPAPSRRRDAIQITLTTPRHTVRPAHVYRGEAQLLVPGRAWRSYPDQAWGLRAYRPWESDTNPPVDQRGITADLAQVAPDRAWPVLGWHMTSQAEMPVRTVESACGGRRTCTPVETFGTLHAGEAESFSGRPVFTRTRPSFWSFTAWSGEGVLFDARMPWPR